MRFLVEWLIERPARIARYLTWLAPLVARITVGWVFLWSGWGKLSNLPQVTENFIGWGIPFPHILTPFVSGVEFFGGMFLLVGLFSRISAGALGITMIVAIRAAKWGDVDSLETLLGFDEFEYLALFLWLAIAGAGVLSLDHLLQRWVRRGGSGSAGDIARRREHAGVASRLRPYDGGEAPRASIPAIGGGIGQCPVSHFYAPQVCQKFPADAL